MIYRNMRGDIAFGTNNNSGACECCFLARFGKKNMALLEKIRAEISFFDNTCVTSFTLILKLEELILCQF